MMTFLKANLLALYALALLSLFVTLPWSSGPFLQRLTLIVLVIHVVELLFAFKYVRTYKGPLGISVLLTLLFGLFHWLPLARAKSQEVTKLP